MTDAELAHTKELAFFMVERVFMNPISAKLLSEDWRKEFPDEVAVAERMKALVEALEKAQAKNALVAGGIEAATKLHERIAELESRTVTVKLPPKDDVGAASTSAVTVKLPGWFVKDAIAVYDRDEVEEALTAAGIKWEAA